MFLKNLFRWDDPYLFHFRLLALVGIWRVDSPNKLLRISYKLFRALVLLSLTYEVSSKIADIFFLLDNTSELTSSLCTSVVSTIYLIRIYSMLHKSKKILSVDEILQKNLIINPTDNAFNYEVVQKSRKEIIYVTKIFYAMASSTAIFWMVYPVLENSEKKNFPVPHRNPLDVTQSPLYEIIYFYLSISLITFMVTIISSDLVYFGFIVRIMEQYDILGNELKSITQMHQKRDFEFEIAEQKILKNEESMKVLIKCCNHHQTLLRLIDQVLDIYRSSLFIQMTGGCLLLCVAMFDVVKTNDVFTLQQLQRSLYFGCILFDLFFFCYYGTCLEQKSLQLVQNLYDISWPDMDIPSQKFIILFMLRAQKVPRIMAGKSIPINLPTYLNIVKLSYNTMALLRQTVN